MSDSLQTVTITDSEREKENEPNSSTTGTSEVEGKNSPRSDCTEEDGRSQLFL